MTKDDEINNIDNEKQLITFGKYTYGNPEIRWKIHGTKVVIGNFTSIAENVKIYLGNGFGHDAKFITTYPFEYIHKDIFKNVENKSKNTNGDVIIGNDVGLVKIQQ
jgi:chloramphenicol O-acetyltransferase type B